MVGPAASRGEVGGSCGVRVKVLTPTPRTPTGPMAENTAIADTICRTIDLGVTITGAALDGQDRTHLYCELLAPDDRCPGCGAAGRLRDHVHREVADLPIVGHPTRLHLQVPRYRCESTACDQSIFRADIGDIVAPRPQVPRRTTAWMLRRMIVDKMSVTAWGTPVRDGEPCTVLAVAQGGLAKL